LQSLQPTAQHDCCGAFAPFSSRTRKLRYAAATPPHQRVQRGEKKEDARSR
jgi:hypothetical protein